MMSLCATAQNVDYKKVESNIFASVGTFTEHRGLSDMGMCLNLSYGLDFRFNEHWSLMPRIGYRDMLEDIVHIGWVGGDPDFFSFLDFYITPRYHYSIENTNVVYSIAPVFSKTINQDRYYVDAYPSSPLDGLTKIKPSDFGISSSLLFEIGKHWSLGVEAYFDLGNVSIQYPELDVFPTRYIRHIFFTSAFRF